MAHAARLRPFCWSAGADGWGRGLLSPNLLLLPGNSTWCTFLWRAPGCHVPSLSLCPFWAFGETCSTGVGRGPHASNIPPQRSASPSSQFFWKGTRKERMNLVRLFFALGLINKCTPVFSASTSNQFARHLTVSTDKLNNYYWKGEKWWKSDISREALVTHNNPTLAQKKYKL